MDTFDLYLKDQLHRLKCRTLPTMVQRALRRRDEVRACDRGTLEIRGHDCGTLSNPLNASGGGAERFTEWNLADGYKAGVDRGR